MNCAKHTTESAVGICLRCNRGLCSHCTQRFTRILCEDCLIKENASVKRELKRDILYTLIAAVVAATTLSFFPLFVNSKDIGPKDILESIAAFFIIGILVMGIPSGWRLIDTFLAKIRGESDSGMLAGNPFLLMTIGYFYYVFKFFVALCVGVIVGPYSMWAAFRRIRSIEQTEASITQGLI